MKMPIRQGIALIKGNNFGEVHFKIHKWASYVLIRKPVVDKNSGFKYYRHVSVNWWGANKYSGCTWKKREYINLRRYRFTSDTLDRIID